MRPSPKLIAILRWLLLAVASLATVAGLVVVVENWRGHRAWAALERELLAKGEKLDFAAFQPTPIADDQNFFKAPLLARILYERRDDPERQQLLTSTKLNSFHALAGFRGPHATLADLRAPLRTAGLLTVPDSANAAADIVTALAPLQPLLDAMRDAARTRPDAALEARVSPFSPPEVAADEIFRVAQALGVRAAANLELGRTDDAFADTFALQRLANGLTTSPATLLNVLVGVTMQGLAAGAISDGAQRHAWSDRQLAEFQRQLDKLQPLVRFAEAIRTERAATLAILDSPSSSLNHVFWPFYLRLVRGWAQQNKVAYCRGLESEVLAPIVAPKRILAERLPPVPPPRSRSKPRFSPYDHLARLGLGNVGAILANLGSTTETLQLNGVSWALERHRLAHDRLPDALADLVPAQLASTPIGIFDGQPLHYEKTAATTYRLYALGKNGRNDGGKDDDIALVPIGGP